MEFFTCSNSHPPSFGFRVSAAVSQVICKLLVAFSAFIFGVVGITFGATTGTLVGLKTKTGVLRGATVGAITGCIFSVQVFKALLRLFDSDDCAIDCFIPLIQTTSNLLSERTVQQRLSSTMEVAAENQADAAHAPHFYVRSPIVSSKGLSKDSMEKIPKTRLACENMAQTLWNAPCCSVCLQDFQLGEMVSILPRCRHTYHQPCIDKWLIGKTSCPLCRIHF